MKSKLIRRKRKYNKHRNVIISKESLLRNKYVDKDLVEEEPLIGDSVKITEDIVESQQNKPGPATGVPMLPDLKTLFTDGNKVNITRRIKYVPALSTPLRQDIIAMPTCIRDASGIKFMGKRVKSIIYTTDVAIINNTDADAILAVYPFTPNTTIIEAILSTSRVPVLAGIGGGLTAGDRCARIATFAEEAGANGVVLNAPTVNSTIKKVDETVDIPIVYTIVSEHTPIEEIRSRVEDGVQIFNVSGGARTPELVAHIRKYFPTIPIIATGGKTTESITATILAGANAISYTPDYAQLRMFQTKMEKYRLNEELKAEQEQNSK